MKRIFCATLLLMISLIGFSQEIVEILIKENTVPCQNYFYDKSQCMQIKAGNDTDWNIFKEIIHDFKYEPGYAYRLKVEKSNKTGYVRTDELAYSYKLIQVISKHKLVADPVIKNMEFHFFDKEMMLTQLNGEPVEKGKVYIQVDQIDRTIFGRNGQGSFYAHFEFKNDELIIDPEGELIKASVSKDYVLEKEFRKAIKVPFKVVENGNKVSFLDTKTNAVVMVFTVSTEAIVWTFINQKEWTLIRLGEEESNFGKTFIQFNIAENEVSGNNGCNNFSGRFSTNGDKVLFNKLRATRMACADDKTKQTARKMMEFLNSKTLRFDVVGGKLFFYNADRLVMIFSSTIQY